MQQLKAWSLIAVLGHAVLTSCASQTTNATDYDVVIVGGGSAGTYAAIALKDAGKNIIIIEQTDELGGNANTYVDSSTGTKLNVGVVDFHNISVVTDYAARLNVPLSSPGTYNYITSFYNFDTGKKVHSFHNPSDAAVGAAMLKYIDILQTNYTYLQAGWFLPDPVPQELLTPFGQWAKVNGISAAVQLFNQLVQNDGDIWSVPTAQIIKAVDISLAQAALEGFLVVASGDTRDLYTSAQSILQGDVLYNSTVASADRSNSQQVSLVVQTPNGKTNVTAKKLLVAIPPTLSMLHPFDLSSQEQGVFGKFQARGYYGSIIKNTGINSTIFFTNVAANNPFKLQDLPGIFTIQPTGIEDTYAIYYGALDASTSSQEAEKGIVQQINTLASHKVFAHSSMDFLYFTNHSPFRMYVSAGEIKNGFYSHLYALQGQQNIFGLEPRG